MKKFLSCALIILCCVCVLSVSAFAATPQSRVIDAIEKVAPAELYKEYGVIMENLAKQVKLTDDQADEIIKLIDEINKEVSFKDIDHMEDLSVEDMAYCVEKLDAACAIADVTYVISAGNTGREGEVIATFYHNGKSTGYIDTHEVKKTGLEDYPASMALVCGAVVMALAAVAFVGAKKFALSK